MSLALRPVTAMVGATISGVDLREPLASEDRDATLQALHDHGVLFFRDQDIGIEQHKEFGRRFGELHIHPAAPGPEGHPEILVVHADENSKFVAGNAWHSDVSCDAEPPLGSILHMHTVPPSGGDTMFASMYAAYEDLSEPMKQLVCGLTAVHASDHVYRDRYKEQGVDDAEKEYPRHEHPVVRTHPETARKALYVNRGHSVKIDGFTEEESKPILEYLYSQQTRPEFTCRFRWTPGAVAFWDNRPAQHNAINDYQGHRRVMHRVTLAGDRPV